VRPLRLPSLSAWKLAQANRAVLSVNISAMGSVWAIAFLCGTWKDRYRRPCNDRHDRDVVERGHYSTVGHLLCEVRNSRGNRSRVLGA